MQKFLVLIIGVIFLGVGGFLYFKNQNLIKNCTVETEATVVDMKQELSTDSDTTLYMYYPIIEYTVNGNTVRLTMDSGSNTPQYSINDKITILYNPNKTKEYIIKGDQSSNIFSIVFAGLGLIITGYGIVVALKKEN